MCLKLLLTLKGHRGAIWSILWGVSGNYLISVGVDSSLVIWGPSEIFFPVNMYKKSVGEITYFNSWAKLYQLKMSKVLRTFRSLAKKVNSNYFSISDFLGNSYLWGIIFLKCFKICIVEINHNLKGHSSEIKGCDFSSSENVFSSCGRDRNIWVWKKGFEKTIECSSVLKKSDSDIKCIKWNPRYTEIASGVYGGNLILIIFEKKKKKITELNISNSVIWNIIYDKLGKNLILGNGTGEIFFLNSIVKNTSYLDTKMSLNRKYFPVLFNLVFLSCNSIQNNSRCGRNFLFAVADSNGSINLTKNQKIIRCKKKKNQICEKKNVLFLKILSLFSNSHYGKINTILWHPFFENVFVSCGDDSNLSIWRIRK